MMRKKLMTRAKQIFLRCGQYTRIADLEQFKTL